MHQRHGFPTAMLAILLVIATVPVTSSGAAALPVLATPSLSLDHQTTHGPNKTHIDKRVQRGYNEHLSFGKQLLKQMNDPVDKVPQSKWEAYTDLETYGWEVVKSKTSEEYKSSSFAKEQPSLAHIYSTYNINTDPKLNHDTEVMNSKNVMVGGKKYLKTDAAYINMLNPRLIVATWNYGPGRQQPMNEEGEHPPIPHVAKEDRTPLQRWCNLMFIQYRKLYGTSAKKLKQLRFVLQTDIVNESTEATITAVMRTKYPNWEPGNGLNKFQDGTWFDMTTDEGVALLGTENGVGVAQLLAQYKEQMGHKTVRRVNVFRADSPHKGFADCALFFELENGPQAGQVAYLERSQATSI